MASEYVSFMLVFGLGISMVVGITLTMQNLSDSVFDTSAKVALDTVIDQVKGAITDGITNENQWLEVSASYQHNLDISSLLVNKYPYEISVQLVSGTYYVVGQTVDTQTNISVSSALVFTSHDVTINGTLNSSSSNPFILFTKDSSNTIVVTLGNR